MSSKTKSLVLMAMFIALCAVGATIKVPSPTGTVGLDALPGFLAALVMGPRYGIPAAALGHLFSSLFAGFPMTLPLHIIVALQMAVTAGAMGYLNHFSLPLASVVAILINGIAAPACFILLPQFGMPFFIAMLVPLLVASAINVVGAAVIYKLLPEKTCRHQPVE